MSSRPDEPNNGPTAARVVHRSVAVEKTGSNTVVKLMLNLTPGSRTFEAGSDIAFLAPGFDQNNLQKGLRRYTIESVGEVPFEDSIDVTIYVRDSDDVSGNSVGHHLVGLSAGDELPVYGPFNHPFYPPMGSRSNMILVGAGCGMVPFRSLAHKVQARKLDWMGKVLMLHGSVTALEHIYLNDPGTDQDQYFDAATHRAFEALKTRYSATAFDHIESAAAHREALWRLMGQGSVYVYLAGYRSVAEALDKAMADHLRLAGRWQEAKSALMRDGHWLEYLYD